MFSNVKKRAESRCRAYLSKEAAKRGWNIRHPERGGDVLEEQEIADYFPDIGLELERPDFLFVHKGLPVLVAEAKNDFKKIDTALQEAIHYADKVNLHKAYMIKLALGAAGDPDHGFVIKIAYLKGDKWEALTSDGYEITNIPTKRELELAIRANDATTSVDIPSVREFIDGAIQVSGLLRAAKVETQLRPKVIGALILAMYQDDIMHTENEDLLNCINQLTKSAIYESVDLSADKRKQLSEALYLSRGEYKTLNSYIGRIIAILRSLNIRSVLQTDTDFLGLFYEAFLRYGYDNNALGIVFTPRHITKFCAEISNVRSTDKVIDLACGTGGFLVAAFDKMMGLAKGPKAIEHVKNSLRGCDTNPTIWALATLNMFFRGDGKSHIEHQSCFDKQLTHEVAGKFTKAFLNPPFSQQGEPEKDFIDASLNALEPEGTLVAVVKAGIFADNEHSLWRREFLRHHTLEAVISLPDDLFYPTATPSSLLIARAHIPQPPKSPVFFGKIWEDGFQKLKGKRVESANNQLPEILDAFRDFKNGRSYKSIGTGQVAAENLLTGAEWSPQKWLPSQSYSPSQIDNALEQVRFSLFKAVAAFPELSEQALIDLGQEWDDLPVLNETEENNIGHFFEVLNGKSQGEKTYLEGNCPYISSGDPENSIVRLVQTAEEELFPSGGISVTAFGQAYVQPWPFMARGNGGSAVKVLIPKFQMRFEELIWFAAQINLQKWRFFYARMAIKSRIEKLIITSPNSLSIKPGFPIAARLQEFRQNMAQLALT